MSRFTSRFRPLPRELRGPTTQGRAGFVWRAIGYALAIVVTSTLVANLTLNPSKRNIQLLAGVIFLALVLIAHPRKALLFTLAVIPFPGYTTVGSTSTLLILALAALVVIKSRELDLPSPFENKRADLALIGFVLLTVLSLYQVPGEYLHAAVNKTMGLVSAVVLYYVILHLVRTQEQLMQALKVVMVVSVLLATIAILQYLFPERQFLPSFFKFSQKMATMEEIRRGEVRSFATFPGFELFAEYMVMSLFLHYLILRGERDVTRRLLWVGAMLITVGAVFATGTRAGIIALALGATYLVMNSGRSVPRGELFRVLFVGLALFYLSLPFLSDYYGLMLERLGDLQRGTEDGSVQGRTKVLFQAIDAVANRPFTGHGFYEAPDLFRGWVGMHIHNLYVTLAYKIGLLGLIAFVWFVAVLWLDSWRTLKNLRVEASLRAIVLFLNTALTIFLIDELKIEFTRDPLTMQTSFALFAFLGVATRLARRSSVDSGLGP